MTQPRFTLDPIAQLWRIARRWCAEACAALGGPAAVARAIAREAYAAARRRIGFLEAFALKLLLVEAARLPAPPPPRRPHANAAAARRIVCAAEDPLHPETWRVRFHTRLAPSRCAPQRQSNPARKPAVAPNPAKNHAQSRAQALARRFEALRRIIAAPQRAAAALARRLVRLGARAHAVAHRIALVAPRQGGGPAFAEAIVHAADASVRWRPDTS